MAKVKAPPRSDTEVRQMVLQYFYDRNKNARSARSDRSGSAVKISVVNRELRSSHDLSQREVRSNLTYLISQGWIDEKTVTKTVRLPTGTLTPQETTFYQISAAGIDKIDGPGEFTMPKFHGVKIESTGQNIITVGDGNQVNAKFEQVGSALAELRAAITESSKLSETDKVSAVCDIDSIQSQLAKPDPNAGIIRQAWRMVEKIALMASLVANAARAGTLLAPWLTSNYDGSILTP